MTFTYSSVATTITSLHRVRQVLGDTDATSPLFTDEEIQVYLDDSGDSWQIAASYSCLALAARFARAYDFETDSQKFARSQMSKMYRDMASELYKNAVGIDSVVTVTVDGYSQTIDNEAVRVPITRRQPWSDFDYDIIP